MTCFHVGITSSVKLIIMIQLQMGFNLRHRSDAWITVNKHENSNRIESYERKILSIAQ